MDEQLKELMILAKKKNFAKVVLGNPGTTEKVKCPKCRNQWKKAVKEYKIECFKCHLKFVTESNPDYYNNYLGLVFDMLARKNGVLLFAEPLREGALYEFKLKFEKHRVFEVSKIFSDVESWEDFVRCPECGFCNNKDCTNNWLKTSADFCPKCDEPLSRTEWNIAKGEECMKCGNTKFERKKKIASLLVLQRLKGVQLE